MKTVPVILFTLCLLAVRVYGHGVDIPIVNQIDPQQWQATVDHRTMSGFTLNDALRILKNGPQIAKLTKEVLTMSPMMNRIVRKARSSNAYVRIAMDAVDNKPPQLADILQVVMKKEKDPLPLMKNLLNDELERNIRRRDKTEFKESIKAIMGTYNIHGKRPPMRTDFTNNKYSVKSDDVTKRDVKDIGDVLHFLMANVDNALQIYEEIEKNPTSLTKVFYSLTKMDFSMTETQSDTTDASDDSLASRADLNLLMTMLMSMGSNFHLHFPVVLTFNKLLVAARSGIIPMMSKIAQITRIVIGP